MSEEREKGGKIKEITQNPRSGVRKSGKRGGKKRESDGKKSGKVIQKSGKMRKKMGEITSTWGKLPKIQENWG